MFCDTYGQVIFYWTLIVFDDRGLFSLMIDTMWPNKIVSARKAHKLCAPIIICAIVEIISLLYRQLEVRGNIKINTVANLRHQPLLGPEDVNAA